MEGPQKTKKRRKRTNTQRKIVSPPPQETLGPKVILEEKEEEYMKSPCDKIQEPNANREGKGKASLAKIDLDKEQMNLEIASRYQGAGPTTSQSSKASIFKELPSFVGDYKSRDDIKKVPS